MREILFRGKRVVNGEWVEGYYVYDEIEQTAYIHYLNKHPCGWDLIPFKVIPETVGQYTGLCDKNGKRIFEGDILKGKHEWKNWNTSFGNDEQDFLEQKIRSAYGKYIDKAASDIFGKRYHYFRNYAVEYYASDGGWRVRNGSCFHALTKSYVFNRELEVIGNIHDNHELLKGGDE